MRVLQEAGVLCDNEIAHKTKVNKKLTYEKYPFFSQNKDTVLRLARSREAFDKFPTKINPKSQVSMKISFPKSMVDVRQLHIDDIDSFATVRKVKLPPGQTCPPLDEKQFKEGIKKIIGEEGIFQDWGGERNDLFSTRLLLNGRRTNVAIGFKGKATGGILFPRKMGKRGDQIQRLFSTPADIFIVQYWGQIDESIVEQLNKFSVAKSALEGRRICYGIIDGQDTLRILTAYENFFWNK